jgi:flagellar hook-length control protein FliK
VSSIEALKLSSQSQVYQASNSYQQKNDVTKTSEKSGFSKLFQSLSSEGQKVKKNQHVQDETLKKLEKTLKALQEIPKETLSPEEQATLSSMLQMLFQQTTEMTDIGPEDHHLMSLIQQIEKELNELSTMSITNFGEDFRFVGADREKVFSSNPIVSGQGFQPLNPTMQQSEIQLQNPLPQQTAGSQHISLQQDGQIEKLIQQLDSLIQDLESNGLKQELGSSSLTQESQSNRFIQVTESNKQDPLVQSAEGQVQPNQVSDGQSLEQVQNYDSDQPITGTVLQDVKASQSAQSVEAGTKTPTVRMTNLIEDLREILSGSFRLRANEEGTQLRINIYPELLGHLDIRLTAIDGKIAAQIFTSSVTAKEALDQQIYQLRNSLIQQGITIDKIEINHQNSQLPFGQQQAEQGFSERHQRQGASSQNKNAYHMIEEEAVIERSHLLDGSLTVNYTI